MTTPGALTGVRVIDLTTVLMGPIATRMLGDHGADVIRVETLVGDSGRQGAPFRNPGMPGFVLNLQRNKRSLALDLKHPDGRAAMDRLLDSADVLVTNMRRGALERLGLDAAAATAERPELIHVTANGFGSAGPRRDEAAYDDAIQAASGLAGLFARVDDGEPRYVPSVVVDKIVGLHIVQAVMAALLHRGRTGEGQSVEVPMYETMAAFNLVEHLRGAAFEPPLTPIGYERLLTPTRRPFAAKDGWICILPYTTRNWEDFLPAVGRGELLEDERFNTHWGRVQNIDELYAVVAEVAPARTCDEWLGFCEAHSIPAARIADIGDLENDPHMQEVGLFEIAEHPSEGEYRYVHDAISYSASPTRRHRHAPTLGQHNAEVLTELGFTDGEIRAMREAGAIP